jgi:integrase
MPLTSWVKSWRKLMDSCGMNGFRFHDLRHTFRTQGAEAGVPLEVMMAQLGHMDRQPRWTMYTFNRGLWTERSN